jgi:hypothetical protein
MDDDNNGKENYLNKILEVNYTDISVLLWYNISGYPNVNLTKLWNL